MPYTPSKLERLKETLRLENEKTRLENRIPMVSPKTPISQVSGKSTPVTSISSTPTSQVSSSLPVLVQKSNTPTILPPRISPSEGSANSILPIVAPSPKKSLPNPSDDLYDFIAQCEKKRQEKAEKAKLQRKLQQQAEYRKELERHQQLRQKSLEKTKMEELQQEVEALKHAQSTSVQRPKPAHRNKRSSDLLKDVTHQLDDQVCQKKIERKKQIEREKQELALMQQQLQQEYEMAERKKKENVCKYRNELDKQMKEKKTVSSIKEDQVESDEFVNRIERNHEESLAKQRKQFEKWNKISSTLEPIFEKLSPQSHQRLSDWAQMSVNHRKNIQKFICQKEAQAKQQKIEQQKQMLSVLNDQVQELQKRKTRVLEEELHYGIKVDRDIKLDKEMCEKKKALEIEKKRQQKAALEHQIEEKKKLAEGNVSMEELKINQRYVRELMQDAV
ncbi:hypothetical protein GEMRC1_007997 [Eukaryota sp. GEM-RC1]